MKTLTQLKEELVSEGFTVKLSARGFKMGNYGRRISANKYDIHDTRSGKHVGTAKMYRQRDMHVKMHDGSSFVLQDVENPQSAINQYHKMVKKAKKYVDD
jgi:hypothetical protein